MDETEGTPLLPQGVKGSRSGWLPRALMLGDVKLSEFSKKMLERDDDARTRRRNRKVTWTGRGRTLSVKEQQRRKYRNHRERYCQEREARKYTPKGYYLWLRRKARERGYDFKLSVAKWKQIIEMLQRETGLTNPFDGYRITALRLDKARGLEDDNIRITYKPKSPTDI